MKRSKKELEKWTVHCTLCSVDCSLLCCGFRAAKVDDSQWESFAALNTLGAHKKKHSPIQCSAIQCSSMQFNAVQCSSMQSNARWQRINFFALVITQ